MIRVEHLEFPVGNEAPIVLGIPGPMGEDQLTGLLRYWEDTASCNGVPCRLEYHDMPDGSQIVARFDVRGTIWQTLQITR